MNGLHKLIYQTTQNPNIVNDLIQNSQSLIEKFNLSTNEVTALKTILTPQGSLQALTTPNTLQETSKKHPDFDSLWI